MSIIFLSLYVKLDLSSTKLALLNIHAYSRPRGLLVYCAGAGLGAFGEDIFCDVALYKLHIAYYKYPLVFFNSTQPYNYIRIHITIVWFTNRP